MASQQSLQLGFLSSGPWNCYDIAFAMCVPCPVCLNSAPAGLAVSGASDHYLWCQNCDVRFMNPSRRVAAADEKEIYLLHNNDVKDPRYQRFVMPLFEEIRKRTSPHHRGLDFGAGTGPVLTMLLQQAGYNISLYDPFFWPHKHVLQTTYDFVFASEVVEHFFQPAQEFALLRRLLTSGGSLAIMTLLYDPSINFEKWHYRNDPTHVCFYSKKTFDWIATHFGFTQAEVIGDRVVVLKAP